MAQEKKKTALQQLLEFASWQVQGLNTPDELLRLIEKQSKDEFLKTEREQIEKAVNHGISIDVHSQNNHIDFAKSYYTNTYEQ